MRIYEGGARQSYEAVLRSLGALIDQRGMREITLNETDDGFILQGLAPVPGEEREWSDPQARLDKETFHLRADDLPRFMEESLARREGRGSTHRPGEAAGMVNGGFYESALRVIGAYIDQQQPRNIFFFEQDQQFVMRLLMSTRSGLRHVLVEFTREEIDSMVAAAQEMRGL